MEYEETSQKTSEPLIHHEATAPRNAMAHREDWRADAKEKWAVLCAVILPWIVSAALLAMSFTGYRSIGPLATFASKERATTQIIVSAVSSLLGVANIFTVTKLLNFSTRIQLVKRSLSLDRLHLLHNIATGRMTIALPVRMIIISVVTFGLFMIPAFLWTGALTPVLTQTTVKRHQALQIPKYSNPGSDTSSWAFNGLQWQGDCFTIVNEKGIFGNCAANTMQNRLLTHAAQANRNSSQLFAKNDNSQYSFVNRSFGLGASVGLVDADLVTPDSLAYNYTEYGYYTDVKCIKNDSLTWGLELIKPGSSEFGIPNIYYAVGQFPNTPQGSNPDFFAVTGMTNSDALAVIGAKASEGQSIILLTTGKDYAALNNTQCEVTFTPKLFAIGVDVVSKLITVRPQDTSVTDPDPFTMFDTTGGLADTVIKQTNVLGMITTTSYTSTIGDAITNNIMAASASHTVSSVSVLPSMTDFFTALLDDLLLFVGSSQLFLPVNGTTDHSLEDVNLIVNAVQIGEKEYTMTTFILTTALLLFFVAEAVHTRAWRFLPRWDSTNFADIMMASAFAGRDIIRSDISVVSEQTGKPIGPVIRADDSDSEDDTHDKATAADYLLLGQMYLGLKPIEVDEEDPISDHPNRPREKNPIFTRVLALSPVDPQNNS